MIADTIVAPATPHGSSLRAVVRLSGCDAFRIAGAVEWEVWRFPAPRSVTGEDVAEIHITPGSRWFVESVLEACVARGARVAAPGEFTLRAFRNGRSDLARAEAVGAIVAAQDREEARAAAELLGGALTVPVRECEAALTSLAAEVEAQIDFVDQDIRIIEHDAIRNALEPVAKRLGDVRREVRTRRTASDRPNVILIGPANAGKTTLFNRLTGSRGLVSDRAGTTRDLVAVDLGRIRLWDSAGLDAPAALDALAGARSREAAGGAEGVVLVVEAGDWERARGERADIVVVNKVDTADPTGALGHFRGALAVSAVTGSGVDRLKSLLEARFASPGGGGLPVTARQGAALDRAGEAIERARTASTVELVAADLREALDALGEVTGRCVTEEVLSSIFSRFCLGK